MHKKIKQKNGFKLGDMVKVTSLSQYKTSSKIKGKKFKIIGFRNDSNLITLDTQVEGETLFFPNELTKVDQLKDYNTLMDALNRIDQLASISAEDSDNGEAQQLEKDYNKIANFIKKHSIK